MLVTGFLILANVVWIVIAIGVVIRDKLIYKRPLTQPAERICWIAIVVVLISCFIWSHQYKFFCSEPPPIVSTMGGATIYFPTVSILPFI